MTQEFHISVTPVGSDEYLVRTERVAPGVPLAEEQVVWTLDEWLAHSRQLMNNPLLELLQGNGTRVGGFEFYPPSAGSSGNGTTPTPTLLELGQTLYNSLFQGTLRDSWMTARGIAQHKGEMLRLRLGLKGARLPRLPWEVMNAGDRDGMGTMRRPIATGTDVVFSRYQPGISIMGGYHLSVLEVPQPLRVLLAIAAPTDQERLELRREAEHLQAELQQTQPLGGDSSQGKSVEFEVTVLEQPGRADLTQALEQGQYHIFHYAGHSNLGVAGGNLYLVNPHNGLTESLSGDDLAGLLVNNSIRMVLFNSCRGTHSSLAADDTAETRNLAEALVSRGIPAVLAMAERIPDDVALTLTRLFYRNLKQGYPLDLSLSRARQGLISSFGSNQLYWALPVLYLHPEWDGYLAAGDRTRINPADRLVLAPQVTHVPPKLAGEEPDPMPPATAAADADAEWDMISKAVLTDDAAHAAPAVPGSPLPPEPDELSYEPDAPDIAELIQELAPPDEAVAPDAPAAEPEAAVLEPELASATSEATSTSLTSPSTSGGKEHPEDGMVTIYPTLEPQDDMPEIGVAERGATETTAIAPRRNRAAYIVLPLLGAAAMAVTLALMPNGWLRNGEPTPGDLLPPTPSAPNSPTDLAPTPDSVALTEEDQLRATAIQQFDQGNIEAGTTALAALLDRNALGAARAVYATLTPEQVSEPAVLYLAGRQAWLAMRQDNLDYTVDDARRYWKTAIEKEPNVPAYHNALGFAYYREDKLQEAVQSWCRAIALINTPDLDITTAPTEAIRCPPPDALDDSALLTPYTGIALVYRRIDADPSIANVEAPLAQAKEINDQVITANPDARNPQELPNGWLWTEEMLGEWDALNRTTL